NVTVKRDRLSDHLSERTTFSWTRTRRTQGIHHPAQPLVSWFRTNLPREKWPSTSSEPVNVRGSRNSYRNFPILECCSWLQAFGAYHSDPLSVVRNSGRSCVLPGCSQLLPALFHCPDEYFGLDDTGPRYANHGRCQPVDRGPLGPQSGCRRFV